MVPLASGRGPSGRTAIATLTFAAALLCGTPAPLAQSRHVVYGGDDNFPPYEFLDDRGRPDGFNVRLVQRIAADAGWTLDIRLRPWRETMAALETGAVDLASIARSQARETRYDFLSQIWTLRQAVLFLPGREQYPDTMSGLGHETVAVEDRSVVHEMLAALPEVQRPLLVETRSQQQALEALLGGRATAVAGNALTLRYFLTPAGIDVVEVPVKAVEYHLVTQHGRGQEFSAVLAAMQRLTATGELSALVEAHLASPPPSLWRRYAGYLTAAVVAGLALLGAALVWNSSLRRQVRERTRELTAAQRELEQRVDERTQALALVNRALEKDIEERQATERALRESEGRLESAMRGARLHFWDLFVDRRRVETSPRLLSLLGYQTDHMHGEVEPWQALMHPDDLSRIQRAFAAHAAGATPFVEEECRLRHANGIDRWFTLDGCIVEYAPDGHPTRISGTVRSIDDKKRLEADLLQAQRLEGLGRLAGGVAHDFNNLLTAILGHTELLEQRLPGDDARQEEVREIVRAARRAAGLTRQLLAFARRQPVAPRVVQLDAVVSSIERLLQRLLGEEIALVVSPDPSEARAWIDPAQLEQVVINLTVNARDAMPQGGRVTIETTVAEVRAGVEAPAGLRPGRYACLRVSDTGTGIPPDVLAHVFEPFFTTKEVGKGTGLGLSTSYGIIRQAGGAIEAQSALGRGTRFTIWLPAVDEAAMAPAREEQPGAHTPAAERKTILVAEDESQVRDLVQRLLERLGYSVLSAGSGPEALALAKRHPAPIDLLVSDVVMPQMSGPELAGRLRGERPSLLVLFISGYAEREGHRVPTGAPLLYKPFSLGEFVRVVNELLASPPTTVM